MSRLLHSLKQCHACLMVMTRVCVCARHKLVCVSVSALVHTLWMHLLPAQTSCFIGCGKWKAVASQPPIPGNRSMAHSSDRRQSKLALMVGANERGLTLWLCKEVAAPQLMLTCSVGFDALHTCAVGTVQLFGLYWHLIGGNSRERTCVIKKNCSIQYFKQP